QRLAPSAAHLAAQHVEILRRSRRLADLHIVLGGELHEPLHARAGMLRSLAFIAMGQKHYNPGRQIPFVFARADELVADHLRAVGKIAKLRFPQYQRFGTVPAKAILETEAARLGKRGIVDFAESLRRRKV